MTSAAPAAIPPQYGQSLDLATAKKIASAAETEAARNGWPMVIAIVDAAGRLVLLHRMDQAQNGSVLVAEQKARTAADFRRPTRAFEEALASGGLHMRILAMTDLLPVAGGLPIIVDGRIVGAIGVSGMTPNEDEQVARAGIEAVGLP